MEIIRKKPGNDLHPWVPELQEQLRKGQISRREFLRYATLLGVSLGGATALAACGTPPAACTGSHRRAGGDRSAESGGRPAARGHHDHRLARPAH